MATGMDDRELIHRYAQTHDHAAFAELVRRHGDWVYSSARRQVGDSHLAEDITQAVFLLLSRRAPNLTSYTYLSGWLFNTLRYCAQAAIRQRSRRQHHERQAATMHANPTSATPDWSEISPILDQALARLKTTDREAVLLRFYEQKPLAEVGRLLGITEEAARKRVDRAVDRLRQHMAGRGGEAQSLGLSGLLLARAVEGCPPGLVEKITASAGLGTGTDAAGAIARGAAKMMAMVKVKVAAIVVATATVVVAATVTGAAGGGVVPAQPSAASPAAVRSEAEPKTWGELATRYRAALEKVSTISVDQRAEWGRGRLLQVNRAGGVRLEHGPTLEIATADGVLWRTNGDGWTRQQLGSSQAAILDGVVRWVGPIAGDEEVLMRDPAEDQAVAGVACKAYRVPAWASPLLLVDADGLIRRRTLSVSATSRVVFDVEYNGPLGKELFTPPSAAVNAVDTDAWFAQHYPLGRALWQTTAGGSIVALHSVERDPEGRIYLQISTRLTETLRRDAPGLITAIMPADQCLKWGSRMIVDTPEPDARLLQVGQSVGGWWWTAWLVYEPRAGATVPARLAVPMQLEVEPGSGWWLKSHGLAEKVRVELPVDVAEAKLTGTYAEMMSRWFGEIAEADRMSVWTLLAYSKKGESGSDTIEGHHLRDQTAEGLAKAVRAILAIPMRFKDMGDAAGE